MAMDSTIDVVVDARGKVFLAEGMEAAADHMHRFELSTRRMLGECGDPTHARAALTLVNQCVGTPDRLMEYAAAGRLPKSVLLELLTVETRRTYLDACSAIEKQYTDECAASNDPCLESGCAVEGEICLQPLLRAGSGYRQRCAAVWIELFANPRNRVEAWRS
jgi:hypothetical protein